MIYVTYRNSYLGGRKVVKNIWSVDCEDVEQRYIEFMREKAHEINIVINPHWLNIMNWKDHNNHLSIEEYREKTKAWLIKEIPSLPSSTTCTLTGYSLCRWRMRYSRR